MNTRKLADYGQAIPAKSGKSDKVLQDANTNTQSRDAWAGMYDGKSSHILARELFKVCWQIGKDLLKCKDIALSIAQQVSITNLAKERRLQEDAGKLNYKLEQEAISFKQDRANLTGNTLSVPAPSLYQMDREHKIETLKAEYKDVVSTETWFDVRGEQGIAAISSLTVKQQDRVREIKRELLSLDKSTPTIATKSVVKKVKTYLVYVTPDSKPIVIPETRCIITSGKVSAIVLDGRHTPIHSCRLLATKEEKVNVEISLITPENVILGKSPKSLSKVERQVQEAKRVNSRLDRLQAQYNPVDKSYTEEEN